MNKPTQEELDAGIAAALAAGETPPAPSEPASSEPAPVEPQPSKAAEEPQPLEPAPSKPAPEEPEVVDYKKKFVESSRESLVRESTLKKTNEAIEQAAGLSITDDEVQTAYPEWDVLSDTEKRFARESLLNQKRFDLIHNASQEGKDIRAWNDTVDTFIEDPKTLIANPDLEGKQDDFKAFSTKPSGRGADFETLVSAFLFDLNKSRVKHTGKMMETGNGGPNETPKPKDNKLSVEESEQLRVTNYNKYKEYLKEGRIADLQV